MSIDWGRAAKAYFDELPHPRGHGLKIKEMLPAVKLASMLKFGGHAELHEASLFWSEFAPGGVPIMPPQEFEHALERVAPLSYVYHGRPPTLKELTELSVKPAHEVRRYFADLPHRLHPDVSAGDMVKAVQAARPWARQHLEREPVLTEAHYLHHSGESPAIYYARLASQDPTRAQNTQQDGLPPQVRGDGGVRSVASTRGQATNQ